MPTTLPGEQVTENLPPLPNTTPDAVQPLVPATWDDFGRVTRAVFEALQRDGKFAADALLAFIKSRRASRPPTG